MDNSRLGQPDIKKLLKLTCIYWLIVVSSAMTLFPAYSKDSNTLSEPLKAFIDERLNKKVWFGIYIKEKNGATDPIYLKRVTNIII